MSILKDPGGSPVVYLERLAKGPVTNGIILGNGGFFFISHIN